MKKVKKGAKQVALKALYSLVVLLIILQPVGTAGVLRALAADPTVVADPAPAPAPDPTPAPKADPTPAPAAPSAPAAPATATTQAIDAVPVPIAPAVTPAPADTTPAVGQTPVDNTVPTDTNTAVNTTAPTTSTTTDTPPVTGSIEPQTATSIVVPDATNVAPVTTSAPAEPVAVTPTETWSVSGNKATTNAPVELGKTYVAPQNDQVTVTFTKLPDNPGTLSIEEIKLSDAQVKSLNALSDKAYDITSSMTDGTFKYELTLPKPKDAKNVQIKYAENVSGLKNAETVPSGDVKVGGSNVSASLDHFTVYVLTGTPTQIGFTVQPAAVASSGALFSPQPTVGIENASGSVIQGEFDSIVLVAYTDPACTVTSLIPLAGTTFMNTLSGEAAFTDLYYPGTGTIYLGAFSSGFNSSGNPFTACSGAIVVGSPSGIHSISVTPAAPSVVAGHSVQLTAVAKDQLGAILAPQPAFTWHSDSATATVDVNGLVTGVGAGTAHVTAASGGVTSNTSTITVTAAPVNGVCGSDNGATLAITPTHLCSAGTASALTGTGPWGWTCAGLNGGTTANCSANAQAASPLLNLVEAAGGVGGLQLNASGADSSYFSWPPQTGPTAVNPGVVYTLSEIGLPGGYGGTWSCNGGTFSPLNNTLILTNGAIVTCTLTDTFTGAHLALVKSVIDGTGTVPLNDPLHVLDPLQFMLSVSSASIGAVNSGPGGIPQFSLDAGTYTLSELDMAGYNPGAWNCVNNGTGTFSQTGANGADVTLNPGNDLVCTIINTYASTGNLKVNKALQPTSDPGLFNLLIDGTVYAADQSNGGTTDWQTFTAGTTHVISETAGTANNLGDYGATIACTGNAVPLNGSQITVGRGENVTCTITNKRNYVIVASAGANGSISPSGSVPVAYNTSQGFTITPNISYHVADVLVDGSSVGTVTSYNFPNVAANHTIDASFAINPVQDQTINFAALPNKTFGNPDFGVSASASSGLPVTFTASGNCTVSGATVHLTGAGSCMVTADQAGNSCYNAAPSVPQTFTIAKANATIVVTPYNVSFNGLAHTAIGTVTGVFSEILSGLDLTGTTHTNVGFFPIDPWAFTDVTGNYNNTSSTVADNIYQAGQTITFGVLPDKTFGDPDFSVSASASSGLPVTFTASGNCTVSGATVHLTGAGSCTVTADQAGNGTYYAAPSVGRTFTVAKANQAITFTALVDRIIGDPDFSISATADSGLAVSFTASGNCTVSGATVHLTGAGSCTVTADQAGNGTYYAAPSVSQTFAVNPVPSAPVISNEAANTVADTSATITWTTDHLATSRVVYDTVSHPILGFAPNYDYANSTVEDPTLVTSHSVGLTGLTPSTTYYYRTVSHGSPETAGDEQSFTTSATVVAAVSSSSSSHHHHHHHHSSNGGGSNSVIATASAAGPANGTGSTIGQGPAENPAPGDNGQVLGGATQTGNNAATKGFLNSIWMWLLIVVIGGGGAIYFWRTRGAK